MAGLVSLEDAKAYLRVDSDYEDATVITPLLQSAEAYCMEMARLSKSEWDAIVSGGYGDSLEIRGEERDADDISGWKDVLRVSVLFALGYLYEHREEADHHAMALALRSLLYSVREGVF